MKDAYSYPKYCDAAYGWDRSPECDFVEECIRRYSGVKARSILDIACGSGIHLREFARRGWEVMGIDKSKEMASFVSEKAKSEGLKVRCACLDMKKFELNKKFECAICMLDSFRYLLADKDIISHLKSVAGALKPGGLYILDLWMPAGQNVTEWEDVSWVQQQGDIRVDARYRQLARTFRAKDRTFEDELIFKVGSPDFNSIIRSRARTRALFYEELKNIAARSNFFECIGRFYNFDFGPKEGYNTERMSAETAVFGIRTNVILKRKKEDKRHVP